MRCFTAILDSDLEVTFFPCFSFVDCVEMASPWLHRYWSVPELILGLPQAVRDHATCFADAFAR